MRQKGQSLIEVLISIGLIAFFVVAAAGLIAPALRSNGQATQVQAKAQLGNELLQNVKAWASGNWNNALALATGTNNPYYLNDSISPFVVATGSQTEVSKYTFARYFYLNDVYRDASGNVTTTASGNFYDPSTKRVTVVVQNVSSTGTSSPLMYVAYLARSASNVFNQANWYGDPNQGAPALLVNGDFGSSTNVAVSSASGSLVLASPGGIWVPVSGNATFGTPDFLVMKYEAKCSQNGASLGAAGAGYDTGDHTYNDSGYPCTAANGKSIMSTPDGFPIASISHNTALTYCQSINAHLLTNDEYMTIVRDAEQVSSNWSGGSPGSGYMYTGHNDHFPDYALPASSNDANGYYAETNQGGNQRRTFTLSNGSVVWDFAGNVWQQVQRSVNNAGDLTTTMVSPTASDNTAGWEFVQYGSSTTPYVSAWSADVARASVGASNASWNFNQGMGAVLTYGTGADHGMNAFIRGGRWIDGANAGAYALSVDWGTTDATTFVGFRCAR